MKGNYKTPSDIGSGLIHQGISTSIKIISYVVNSCHFDEHICDKYRNDFI